MPMPSQWDDPSPSGSDEFVGDLTAVLNRGVFFTCYQSGQ